MANSKNYHNYKSFGVDLVKLMDIGNKIDAETSKKRYNKQHLQDLVCSQRELTVYILETYPKIVSKEVK